MREPSDKSRFGPLIHIALLVALVSAVYFLRLDHLTIRGEESRRATGGMEPE